MGSENAKVRVGIYIEKAILEQADGLLETANVRSRNEFVAEALKFYMGYLLAGKAENYFLQSLASVLTGTVQDSENRLARMDFKIAVELSKLSQVIAYTHDVDEESLNRLHVKCVDEVRRSLKMRIIIKSGMCRYCWKGNDGKRIYLYFPLVV